MTPTDLADVLDAIARQPAVPLRDIRGELRSAAQMLREMAAQLSPASSVRMSFNGKDLVAPEWPSGNEPEYSRADLHHLDAILSGGPEKCALRPALIDLMASAERLQAKLAETRSALEYVDACFSAAVCEGWIEAKENCDSEQVRDLWQRRISYAWSNTLNVLAALGSQP